MADVYEDTGTNQEYASKMPAINNDADIQEAIKAYHYGDPALSSTVNSADFSGVFDDPDGGIVSKLKYLKTEISGLSLGGIPNSIVNAKGDLVGATANDTPARLAVGTNGYVLKANSSTSTGLEWYDLDTTHLPLGGGTLVGDLTINKATPELTLSATSGNSFYTLEGLSGTFKGLLIQTGSNGRWMLASNSTAESDVATGADFVVVAYNNSGALLGTAMTITRSSLLTTLSSLSVSGAASVTGAVTASTAPTLGGHLTNKTYVDGRDDLKLNLSGGTLTGALYVNDSTNASSTTTGALRTAGGAGIVGNVHLGGALTAGSSLSTLDGNITLTRESVSATLTIAAGAGTNSSNIIFKRGGVSRWATGHNTSLDYQIHRYDSSGNSVNTPILIYGAENTTTGYTVFSDTKNSTSAGTGAVVIGGGLGVGKDIYAGEDLTVAGTTITNTTVTNALWVTNGFILQGGGGINGTTTFNDDTVFASGIFTMVNRSVQTGGYTPNVNTLSGYVFEFANSSNANFNIPADGAQNMPIGWKATIFKAGGAGTVTIVTAAGVTLRGLVVDENNDLALGNSQGVAATIWKRAANDWCVIHQAGLGV